MAAPLQYDQAACLARLQATSTRGVPARIRRVAGCATPTGSAGHAGAMANLKLTFQPDHSAGADQVSHPLSVEDVPGLLDIILREWSAARTCLSNNSHRQRKPRRPSLASV